MKSINVLDDLDVLSEKMEQITSMSAAISNAMLYAPGDNKAYTLATVLLSNLLCTSSETLSKSVDALYKEKKSEEPKAST